MKGITLEFSNAWMHSKLSLQKKSMSMNFGSIMEREEKRFVYRIRCSSDENNEEEEMEEGICFSWVSKCRWLRLEEPFRFLMVPPFEGVIWNFNRFKWKRMKKDEVWALWGVIWTRIEWDMVERRIGNEGFTREWGVTVFRFWNLNIYCNRLHPS